MFISPNRREVRLSFMGRIWLRPVPGGGGVEHDAIPETLGSAQGFWNDTARIRLAVPESKSLNNKRLSQR
jgi:hypothetical protein